MTRTISRPTVRLQLVSSVLMLQLAVLCAASAGIQIDSVTIAEPVPTDGVPRYGKLELLVVLSNVTAGEFYNPDPATGGIDVSTVFGGPSGGATVPGFYDGSDFRVRFSPTATGGWTFAVTVVDPGGTATWTGGSFVCTASPLPGFARIDGHYLRFQEGESLFAAGHNNGWQDDVEQPSFASMASRGESLLTYWNAMPWAQPSWTSPEEPYWGDRAPIENVEQGIASYNQAACSYLDGLVQRAEAAGVYLLPTVWSHGELRDSGHPWGQGWWYNSAYSTVCTASDFFKTGDGGGDTPQWRYQKNFFRYMLARWGYSRAIAGWVVVAELEGTTGYREDMAQALAWCASVKEYLEAADFNRQNPEGSTPLAVFKVDSPSFDAGLGLRSTDSYSGQTDDVGIAQIIASQTATMYGSGKPCFHGEFGGNVSSGATQPTHLHNGIWAGVSAGAAITPLVWCDGGSFPMLTDPAVGEPMRAHLQHLADFMAGIDYQCDPALTPAAVSLDAGDCLGWGMRLADRGFAWIQDTAGLLGGEILSLPGLAAGLYSAAWFDVWADGQNAFRVDSDVIVDTDGVLRIAVPSVSRADLAVEFRKTADLSSATTIYVAGIGMSLRPLRRFLVAQAAVTVIDHYGVPVAGATVTGEWSGPRHSVCFGQTAAEGTVTLESLKAKGTFTYTFTVTDVSAPGYEYDPARNVETSGSISSSDGGPEAPTAVASTFPSSGTAPLAVQFDGTASSDADGVIFTYSWDFGDGRQGNGATVGHTYSGPGTYTATLTVTDNDGLTDSESVTVTVTPSDLASVHVAGIDMSLVDVWGRVGVEASVTVTDADGVRVSGATVAGEWTGVVRGSSDGTTDAEGEVTLASKKTRKTGTVRFTVTAVSAAGHVYDPGMNVETDDSIDVGSSRRGRAK